MSVDPPLVARAAAGLVAALAWLGLAILYTLVAADASRSGTLLASTVSYFSFFTNLTNLLVAVGLGCWAMAPRSRLGAFFGRPATTTAIALYIVVVAVVYTLVLRRLWNPVGWMKVADVLLHDVVPAACVACWALLLPKGGLRWTAAFKWLAYPAAYFAVTLVRGALGARYPYPFLNVARLGYGRVLANGGVLLVVFLLLGWGFVALDRRLARQRLRGTLPPPPAG
jgi:hypothetical protein